jgi:hypothetical protein
VPHHHTPNGTDDATRQRLRPVAHLSLTTNCVPEPLQAGPVLESFRYRIAVYIFFPRKVLPPPPTHTDPQQRQRQRQTPSNALREKFTVLTL